MGEGDEDKVIEADDLFDDLDGLLDDLVKKKEAAAKEPLERRAAATDACFDILENWVNPAFRKASERIKRAELERHLKDVRLPHEGASYLEVRDFDDKPVGPQLVFHCDVKEGVVRVDVGFANRSGFDFSLDPSPAVTRFRSKAGQSQYHREAFTKKILGEKIALYLEIFL